MLASLGNWTGPVVGTLRRHRILIEDGSALPSGERYVRGRSIAMGLHTFLLGERRRKDEEGNEAFFEIRVAGSEEVLLCITHRMFVQREAKVIPRLWIVEATEEIQTQLGIAPGEVLDPRHTLDLVDLAIEHLIAA